MRIEKTFKKLNELGLTAMIVSDIKNIRYLSGFLGDTAKLLLVKDSSYLIVDGRFTEQAQKESTCEVVDYNKSFVKTIYSLLQKHNITKCAFESGNIVFSEYEALSKALQSITLVPTENLIETIRITKDSSELKLIKKALDITLLAFNEIQAEIVPGITEKEIANEIEYKMKKAGATGIAFDTIIASGKNSSLPHAIPTNREIEKQDIIVIDMGASYNGYCADITRTIFIGDLTEKQEMIYNLVSRVQKQAVNIIEEGMKCNTPYDFVVNEFAKENLDKYFVHSLGHGVGLDVHERPFLSLNSNDSFKKGMVVTIEPGIYIPDEFGVRIEDTLLLM